MQSMHARLHASAAHVTRRWTAEHPDVSATFPPRPALETGGWRPVPSGRAKKSARPEEGNFGNRKTWDPPLHEKQLQAHARVLAPMSLPLVTLRLKRPAEPAAPAAARECKPRVAAPPSEELAAANALRGLFAAAPPAPAPTAASAQSKRVLSMVPPRPAAHPSPRPSLSHSHPLRPHTTPFSAPRPLARRPSSSPRTTS